MRRIGAVEQSSKATLDPFDERKREESLFSFQTFNFEEMKFRCHIYI
jgi:hypothetical protein